MSKKLQVLLALLLAFALIAAACGDDDDEGGGESTEATDDGADDSSDAADDAAADDEAMDDEETDDAAADDEAMDDEEMDEADDGAGDDAGAFEQFDANGDGQIVIGVAAAGPRDDNGYYQLLVDFAEEFSAENGFAEPIVSDNIGAEEAAQKMSDLAEQGVDIMFVGATEIAEPLPDLTEQYSEIFWYCNCGAGFQELPGLAQATDWGAAIHYTAGVAMGAVLQEQGGTQAVFLGCCDLNFEQEAYNATIAGLKSVDESFEMEYVGTGDFQFDFDNSANATAAFSASQANGATLAYAYLGGVAGESVAQLATDEGLAVFAAGPADICERDDGIGWTGSIVFDGGVYAETAIELIVAGELTEGTTYQFPTEQGLNGALLCDPSPEAETMVADAFEAVATDGELLGELGAISGEAYGG